MKHFLIYHGITIFWAILIFVFSSISSLSSPDLGISLQDKWTHLVEFGIFGFLLQRSFVLICGNRFRSYFFTFIIGVVYGALDEIHQLFVDGREADIIDFYADTIGIFVSLVLYYIMKQRKLFFNLTHFFVDF